MQRNVARGESMVVHKQAQYSTWQKGGEVVAAAMRGISLPTLFGIFSYIVDAQKKSVIFSS
jgi:hypothetical protein